MYKEIYIKECTHYPYNSTFKIRFNMISFGFIPKKGCKIICRPPTIVGDQLRRGGKCVGLNPLSAHHIR